MVREYSLSLYGEAFKFWTWLPSWTGSGHEMANRISNYVNIANIMLEHVLEINKDEEIIEVWRQVIVNDMGYANSMSKNVVLTVYC